MFHQFMWSDAYVLDWEKAKEFYSDLFGWNFVDQFYEGQLIYTMACQDLSAEPPESTSIVGMASKVGSDFEGPSHWLAYVFVESVDDAVEKIKSANGAIYKEPMDILDAGRMAVCGDPTGKLFMVWQQFGHSGTQLKGVNGSLCWFELITSDTSASADFYSSVFDWKLEETKVNDCQYWLFTQQDSWVGGMHDRTEETGNHELWLPYFQVDNISDCLKTIERWNGSLVSGIFTEPSIGQFAVAADFEGNMFGLTEFSKS